MNINTLIDRILDINLNKVGAQPRDEKEIAKLNKLVIDIHAFYAEIRLAVQQYQRNFASSEKDMRDESAEFYLCTELAAFFNIFGVRKKVIEVYNKVDKLAELWRIVLEEAPKEEERKEEAPKEPDVLLQG